MDDQLLQLEKYIITQWRHRVLADFSGNPLTQAEEAVCAEQGINAEAENDQVRMYGATLIAATVQKKFWAAIQIGDGKCVVIGEDNEPCFPVPDDDSMGGGKTTSLCDSNAIENFRKAFGFDTIHGITAATDGVTDSFIPEKYLEFHQRLY
jgi:hypothetical protein